MLLVEFVPTYEYECPRCERTWEVRQRISEPALTTCDRCGGPVHRLLAAAPFILKGGGWYVTDYPSESRKKAMSSETGDKSPSSSSDKAGASSETKTETKSSGTDKAPAAGSSGGDGSSAASSG
jgi:putative FmdB family regulatory protein